MRNCPKCTYSWAWQLADGRFKCRRCGSKYTWKSAWELSRLSEAEKRRALELFVFGVPVFRQRFRAQASPPALERLYRIFRTCCAHLEECREPFEGRLECDESSFGGYRKGKKGWGAAGKVIVLGIIKRNGQVKAFPLQRHTQQEMFELVCEHTLPGSLYYTDDWRAYASLRVRGDHVVVRKEKGRPKGRDHINGIEGFWSYAKNWLYPFRGVPRKTFHLFLGEVCFRFNHRDEDMFPILLKALKAMPARELTVS